MNGSKLNGPGPDVRKRLSFARQATVDLDEVWDYSEEKWGRDQADRYTTDIAKRCDDLADGKIVPQEIRLKSGRFLRIRSGSHFIFLRDMPDELRVVRVLHERRDVKAALG
jgi:toxin ParE1/3/4